MYPQKCYPALRLFWLPLSVVLIFGVTASAADIWVSNGPYGGSTAVLHPSAHPEGGWYAGVLGYGVYRISEETASWVRRSDGLDNLYIKAIVQDPAQPDTLYAGTRAGVYRTTDGGGHWEPRSGGLSVSHVEALALDPGSPQTLYAGAIWSANWRVYKTTDGGATWANTGPGIDQGLEMRRLLVDPLDGDVVYCATEDVYGSVPEAAGVYKSTDGGDTWFASGDELLNHHVLDLTFDPDSSQTLYAGTYGNEYIPYGGVYVSHNAGASWTWISSGLPTSVELAINDIAVTRTEDSEVPILYAAGSYVYSLPTPPGTWEPRLYKSTNGGASWSECAEGIAYPDLLSVAVDPQDPDRVLAGSNCGGVFSSLDGGTSWSHWSRGLGLLHVPALAVHPLDENIVYASAVAYLDEYSEQAAGVFVSFDGGRHWEPRPRNFRVGDSFYVSSLAIAPSAFDPAPVYAPSFGWMLYKSTDQGLSWQWRGFPHGIDGYWLECVAVDPQHPQVAYVSGGGFEPSYPDIYKTRDYGESWTPVASGFVWAEFKGLAIDPSHTETVYAGTAWEGVYKTTNGGASWAITGPEINKAAIKSIVVDPQHPRHVYAGDSQYDATGVYVSYNGGAAWEPYNDGLEVRDIEALALDSVLSPSGVPYPPILYAGTEGDGVYGRRIDEDTIWTRIGDGLKDRRVYSLAMGPPRVSPAGDGLRRALYAGTRSGAYRLYRLGSPDSDSLRSRR